MTEPDATRDVVEHAAADVAPELFEPVVESADETTPAGPPNKP